MLRDVHPTPFPSLPVLAEALAGVPSPEREGAAIEAAVLICLHDDAVLLARRAVHPADPWSGHAALPGGRWEPADPSLLATALRETEEEVGFDPLAHGSLLGALGTQVGRGRRVDGARIAVFVAALDERPAIALSRELESAHWVPLSALVPVAVRVPELPGTDVSAYAVELAGGDRLVVWGITYAISRALCAPWPRRERSRQTLCELDGTRGARTGGEQRRADRCPRRALRRTPRGCQRHRPAPLRGRRARRPPPPMRPLRAASRSARSTASRLPSRRSSASPGCRRPTAPGCSPTATRAVMPRSSAVSGATARS